MFEVINNNRIKLVLLVCWFLFLSVVFCFPLFIALQGTGNLSNDWDQYFFWMEVPKQTIVNFAQFPFWNPYVGGGNLLFAHPHTSVLSLFFILCLFFPLIVALKISVVVCFFTGLSGMFFLMREYKVSFYPRILSAIIFSFSSACVLHIAEGHICWRYQMLIPWIFLFFKKSVTQVKFLFVSGFLLTLIFFSGSIDILAFLFMFLFIYSFCETIYQKKIFFINNLVLLIFIFIGISAVKLFPCIEFLHFTPRFIDEPEGVSISFIMKMLFNSKQYLLSLMSNSELFLQRDWHEYGGYIGLSSIPFIFFGIVVSVRKNIPLICTTVIILLITMGNRAPLYVWKLVHLLPFYNNMRIPSRYIVLLIFCFAIFVGFGAQYIFAKKFKEKKILIFVCIGFVVFELFMVNSKIFLKTSGEKYYKTNKIQSFAQKCDFMPLPEPNWRSDMYERLIRNEGVVAGYEVLQIPIGAISTEYYDASFYKSWEISFLSEGKSYDISLLELSENNAYIFDNISITFCPPFLKMDFIEKSKKIQDKIKLKGFVYSLSHETRKAVYDFVYNRADFHFFCNREEYFVSDNEEGFLNKKVLFNLKSGLNLIEFKLDSLPFKLRCLPKDKYGKYFTDVYMSEAVNASAARNLCVNSAYTGEIYLLNKKGLVFKKKITPNKIFVELFLEEDDRLIINQNYFYKWRARYIEDGDLPVESYNGLLSVPLGKGKHSVMLYFHDSTFLVGGMVSLVFLLTGLFWVFKRK